MRARQEMGKITKTMALCFRKVDFCVGGVAAYEITTLMTYAANK